MTGQQKLAEWQRREHTAYRKWRWHVVKGSKSPVRAVRFRQYRRARFWVGRWEKRLAGSRPPIVTSADLGFTFQWVFGDKGPITRGAGHYTAGPRAKNRADLIRLARVYHAQHKAQGWGGLSYEALFADDGTILLGNPIRRKSAAVANQNTGLSNTCVPGTTGDRITPACKASIRWYLASASSRSLPVAYRWPKRPRSVPWKGHRKFSGQATACPGAMLSDYEEIWR